MEQDTSLNGNYWIKCQDPKSKEEKMMTVKDGIKKVVIVQKVKVSVVIYTDLNLLPY